MTHYGISYIGVEVRITLQLSQIVNLADKCKQIPV